MHWPLGLERKRKPEHMGHPENDFCRNCLNEDEVKSIQNLLYNCLVLGGRRLEFLGIYSFRDVLSSESCLAKEMQTHPNIMDSF